MTRPEGRGTDTSHKAESKKPAWLWWLLGLLGLLLLLGLILALASDDENETSPRATPSATSSPESAPSVAPGTQAPAPGASTPGSPGGAGSAVEGQLTAGGVDLLADPTQISAQVGQQASGNAVRVESVVADEGFWVGTGPNERVFVFLEPAARQAAGESPFQVEAGQMVTLQGTVTRVEPDFAGRVGVEANEGAAELNKMGAYIDLTTPPQLAQ